MPLMFSSTALFPSTGFPVWMRDISMVNPVTFSASLGRSIVTTGTDPNLMYLAYLAIFAALTLSLGSLAARKWLKVE